MVRNRALSFPRQIIVCLSFSLIIALFALSCQKDGGIKQKDPNALTKSEAKAYFEQTATTLKFLTTNILPLHSYSGFSFTGWYENNVLVCLSNEYGFVVTGDRNLVARFE